MENEQENLQTSTSEENSLMYIVGAVIVVAVVVAGVIMWPKNKTTESVKEQQQAQTTPAPKAQLSKLVCENEWYNPVIGMPKYYLSASGGDVSSTQKVDCTFTVSSATGTILTEKVEAKTTPSTERNGNTFICTTKALEKIPQNTPLRMTVMVTNPDGQNASCSGNVTFK